MTAQDVGIYVVDRIFNGLMVDAQWSLRGPRGFTWWSYRLAQHVEASVPVFEGGRGVCEIRIWTEVVNNVDPEKPVADVVTLPNLHATLSASVWDPQRRTITEYCTAIVHRENAEWMSWLLPVAAIMQNAAAHSRAHATAELLNGAVAESSHLTSGPRPVADELLAAPLRLIAPAGKQPSKFIGEPTRRLADRIGRRGLPGFADDTGFTCELPFTGPRSTAFLMEPDLVESALLEVYPDVEHPDYGSGALMTLALPLRFTPEDVADITNHLNALEARSALPVDGAATGGGALGVLLGAWSPDPRVSSRDRIAFNSFIPSVLARPGVLENLVHYQETRCAFAAQSLGVAAPEATSFWRAVASRGDGDEHAAAGRIDASARADLAVRVMRDAAAQVGDAPTELLATSWRSLVSSRPNDWRSADLNRPMGPATTGRQATPSSGDAGVSTPDPAAGERESQDVGLRLVTSLFDQLQIDAAWALPRERGFTWWSYRLAQHVDVGPPEWNGAVNRCRVRIWTDMVRGVEPDTHPAHVVAQINAEASMNATVWRPDAGTIEQSCMATVDEDNIGWLSKVLAMSTILQNADAHARAQKLAEICGGEPAASNHRLNGERPSSDEMLDVPRDVVARVGAEPSRYAGALMARVEPFLARMQFYGSADASGVTCEVPYTGSTPAAILAERGERRMETSLVQIVTGEPHIRYGNGATITMKLPASLSPEQVANWANWLNTADSQGASQAPLLGAWCLDPDSDRTLAFRTFLPNVLATPGQMENHIAYAATRSEFAAQHVKG